MDEIADLIVRAENLGSSAAAARRAGEEGEADGYFHAALGLAVDAATRAAEDEPGLPRQDVLRLAGRLAIECGEVAEARRLMDEAFASDQPAATRVNDDEWTRIRDVAAWPDAWLVAAVRRDPPDVAALDALAKRHWKALFGRCHLLTVDATEAADLAQDAWCRVLRARHALKPGGNFSAYLSTVATNLWRDRYRSSRRAGPLAENRLASLDAGRSSDAGGDGAALADLLPDLHAMRADEQRALKRDIDEALGRLTPQLREVVVARYLDSESCAQIGRRHGRTEQTISAWVRQGIREMKVHLEQGGRNGLADRRNA